MLNKKKKTHDCIGTFLIPIKQYSNSEDLFLTFPTALLKKVNWKEGDEISFESSKNGFILRKITKTE
jgi:antitoxin component of MazEF toxin-antitoxin module